MNQVSERVFKVGDKGLTRDGIESYEIVSKIVHREQPLVVVLTQRSGNYQAQQRAVCFRENGRWIKGREHVLDLMPPTVTKWRVKVSCRKKKTSDLLPESISAEFDDKTTAYLFSDPYREWYEVVNVEEFQVEKK